MSHITINREHGLTVDQAKQVVETLATQLTDRYECHTHWQDDSLHFERSGIAGQIDVEPGAVRVSVRLGFLLVPLKHRLEQEIHRYLEEGFGDS
jgi:putative polyhydroxyalkanoate system protein